MRMTQRLTALLLALLMLLTMLPAAAFAEAEEVPAETEEVFTDVFSEEPVIDVEAPAEEPTFSLTEAPEEEQTVIPADVPTQEPTAEPTAVPAEEPTVAPTVEPTAEPTAVPTATPDLTQEPTAIPTEEPTSVPTEAPTEVPMQEKAAFVAGLARLASGSRLYEHKGLWGNYVETSGSGVVYAAEQSEDETAIRVVLNNGTSLWEGWVKADAVSMYTEEQTLAYDQQEFDEEQTRTYRSHLLMPITTIGSEPTATPEPVVEEDVFVDADIPLIGDDPITLPSDEPKDEPTSAPVVSAPPEEPADEEVFQENFTEELPEATVEAMPEPSIAPVESEEIGSFVEYRALEAPSGLTASHNRLGKLTLTWKGTEDAEAYQVLYKATGAADYAVLATVTTTSFSTSALDPSIVYYFRVRGVQLDADGDVLNASPHSASIPYIVLGDAKINDPRGKDTSTIRLTWDAVDGANLYDVMMSVHGKNEWSIVRTDLTGTLCDIKNISFDETYDFRVIPKRKLSNGTVITGNSSRTAMVGSPMETPSFQQYDWTETGLKLTWDAIPGASGYVIYRRAFSEKDVNNYQKLVVLDEPVTTYIDTTMEPGEVYYYFVYSFKTCQPEGWRCFSLKGEIGMGVWLPAVTEASVEDLQDQGTRVSWPSITGASHYDVYIGRIAGQTPAGNGNGRVTKPSGYHSSAVVGNTYYYRVRPVRVFSNGDVSTGPWSDEFVHTYQEAEPTYRALLIGNTYPNETNYLPGCDNDARAVATMLRTMTGTPYTVNVQTNLSDSGMINAIRSTFADAKSNDVSLFYYSGHGANTSGASYHGALVGLYHTYLSVTRLKEELDAIPGKKIVILDSCHSGAMIGKSVGDDSASSAELSAFNSAVISAFASDEQTMVKSVDMSDEIINEIFTQEAPAFIARGENDLANSGYYVITAAHSTEQSVSSGYDPDGDKKPNKYFGLFTYGVCYGSGWNSASDKAIGSMPADLDKNSEITLYEAYVYARAVAKQHNPNQNAQIYPANSAMVIWSR